MMKRRVTESAAGREQIGRVFDRHRRRWLKYLGRVLPNPLDAEDALQEAVLRVLAREKHFPAEEDLRMYLGRAVTNTAIELYHARKRERTRQVSLVDQVLVSESPDPYALLERREENQREARLLEMMRRGLRRLPSKEHRALQITVLNRDGLSVRRAGERSGIPYSTLRHQSSRGLKMLREYIAQRGGEEAQRLLSA